MATTENNYATSYNRELVLDLTLQAFYIYDMSSEDDGTLPRLHDYVPISKSVKETVELQVIDSSGNTVVDGSGNAVTVDTKVTVNRTRDPRRENFKFLTTSGNDITLSEYKDYTFTDWVSVDGIGVDFSSYLVTGYNMSGDMLRAKQAIYLTVLCDRTESYYTLSGSSVVLARQSSCMVQAQWDWNVSADQGKWGTAFQAYRLFLPHPNSSPSSGDLFNYGPRVIKTKNKLRGRGDALSLYFSSETGKDMKLLGWGIVGTKNDHP